jgi:hypothetical protein
MSVAVNQAAVQHHAWSPYDGCQAEHSAFAPVPAPVPAACACYLCLPLLPLYLLQKVVYTFSAIGLALSAPGVVWMAVA